MQTVVAPGLHIHRVTMTKMTPLAYVVLLLAAFMLGLMGTLAASRAVAGMSRYHRLPHTQAPASTPMAPRQGGAQSIEC